MSGWGLVAVTYAAVLLWAGAINAPETAAADAVAGAVLAAPADVSEELAAISAIETPAEAPLVTLAIAAAMVFGAAGWYVLHTFRARHPRMRSARLIVRHITTLL